MDRLTIRRRPPAWMAELATVSIAFDVDRVLRPVLRNGGLGGLELVEEPVVPWRKDYDALPDNHPTRWAQQFDVSGWGLFSAHRGVELVGGAVVVFRAPGVELLEGRDDRAVLWDLRVAPASRGTGVGSALLRAAERWAATRGARELRVETQNVNVRACRFYASRGYELCTVRRFAYPTLPEEVQLVWTQRLSGLDAPADRHEPSPRPTLRTRARVTSDA